MTEVVIIFGKMKIILRNFFLIINFVRDWTKTALLHSTTLQWIMTNKKEGNMCLVFLQDLPQNHAYLFSQKSRLPWLRLCKWDEIIQLVIFSHQTYILKVLLRLLLWLLRYHQNPFPDQCPTLIMWSVLRMQKSHYYRSENYFKDTHIRKCRGSAFWNDQYWHPDMRSNMFVFIFERFKILFKIFAV